MVDIHNQPIAERIQWLFDLADRHGNAFRSPEAWLRRERYLSEHPTAIAVLKCMDGRINIPIVTGKPAPAFFNTALAMLGMEAQPTVMIGDEIRGDFDGAQRAGLRAVLMRTGKFRDKDLSQGIEPDAVLGSLEELPDWYRNAGFDQ